MQTDAHKFAKEGDISNLTNLVTEKGTQALSEQDDNRNLPIHLAVQHGHLDCIKFLFDSSTNKKDWFSHTNKQGHNLLHIAVINQQTEVLTYLLATLNNLVITGEITEQDKLSIVNDYTKAEGTPLGLATASGYKAGEIILKEIGAQSILLTRISQTASQELNTLSQNKKLPPKQKKATFSLQELPKLIKENTASNKNKSGSDNQPQHSTAKTLSKLSANAATFTPSQKHLAPVNSTNYKQTIDYQKPVRQPVFLQKMPINKFNEASKDIDKNFIKTLSPATIAIYDTLTKLDPSISVILTGGAMLSLLLPNTKKPNDFDILTTATLQQIQDSFPNCEIRSNSLGKRSIIIKLIINGKLEEIDVVSIPSRDKYGSSSKLSNLIRNSRDRDYKVNTFFYDLNDESIYFHESWKQDLNNYELSTIADPNESFYTDPIRILRGIRIANRYGFTFEKTTEAAIVENSKYLAHQPGTRLYENLVKLFNETGVKKGLELLNKYDLLPILGISQWARSRNGAITIETHNPILLNLIEEKQTGLVKFKENLLRGASIACTHKDGRSLLDIAIAYDLPEHASLLILNGLQPPNNLLQNTTSITDVDNTNIAINDTYKQQRNSCN